MSLGLSDFLNIQNMNISAGCETGASRVFHFLKELTKATGACKIFPSQYLYILEVIWSYHFLITNISQSHNGCGEFQLLQFFVHQPYTRIEN